MEETKKKLLDLILGEKIRDNGLSYRQLSAIMDKHSNYISCMLRGKLKLTTQPLEFLAFELDMTKEDFIKFYIGAALVNMQPLKDAVFKEWAKEATEIIYKILKEDVYV